MRVHTWGAIGLCLAACGGRSVPTLTPGDLESPKLDGLEPRTLSLTVEDRRPVSEGDRRATEDNVIHGLAEVFGSAGIRVLDDAYHAVVSVPVFESSKIRVPAFRDVGVAVLSLEVTDEFSDDGSVGKNVRQELEAALNHAGIQVDENAEQTLVLTVSRPDENVAGRSRATCMMLSADATFQRGSAYSQGTACRGTKETAHHRVMSEMLKGLWTEYKRALGKRR